MADKVLLKNRKAFHEYELLKRYQAGMALIGAEVKSLRQKRGSLAGSYVKLMQGEAWLINAQIAPYQFAHDPDYDPKRRRKLLLHRREIEELVRDTQHSSRTIVPLAFLLKDNHIKVELALAKGKKAWDKRRDLKKRAQDRDAARERKWQGR